MFWLWAGKTDPKADAKLEDVRSGAGSARFVYRLSMAELVLQNASVSGDPLKEVRSIQKLCIHLNPYIYISIYIHIYVIYPNNIQ